MRSDLIQPLKTASLLLILLTLLTGIIYPLFITAIAQLVFPWQANGSLIKQDNKIMGSILIGQSFDAPKYFWGRPSATTPFPYNAANSTGSNLGPSNPDFLALVKKRIDYLRQSTPQENIAVPLIPVDLVTASGSGLDPDISPLAAFYQISRIAKARNVSEKDIEDLIKNLVKPASWGLFGEMRVNVLELNIALDHYQSRKESA
ncbi:MAG TPA: potassium-transporting ATPase subunit KdpC [Gammaproteobacteria bacterium]|jgi:K+-transporting ATPase ATPase C chain|nr:potassium-transporting ATPase subunit KdpC [Gammaproteobacteria bacterium]